MNPLHMTEQDWAQYLQQFEPKTEHELDSYLEDLLNDAKQERQIQSGLSELRCKQLRRICPQWIEKIEVALRRCGSVSRDEQWRIRSGFFHGGVK